MKKQFAIGFICCSRSWGGLEMNVLRLSLWMKDRGWRIVLYARSDSQLYREAEAGGIEVRALNPRGKYGGIGSAMQLSWRTRRDGVRYLFVHSNGDLFMSVLARVLGGRRLRLIYMQHMQVGRPKHDPVHTWEYGHLAAWITPLEILAEGVKEKTQIDHSKIRIVPFGMDIPSFRENTPSKETARDRLDLPQQAVIAGVVGRLDPQKGQHILIKACNELREVGHEVHLLFVGDKTHGEAEPYAEAIAELVQELGLTDRVAFRSHMDDIEFAYAAMDIFVLTSFSETYGMVTIEAMMSGLPVIATDSGGTPGIVKDGSNGLLVKPQDHVKLSKALERLITDPDLSERLAGQARTDAEGLYSHSRECEGIEELLEELEDDG